jgi:hypothetical protein
MGAPSRHFQGRQTDFRRTPGALAIWLRCKHLQKMESVGGAGLKFSEPASLRQSITVLTALHGTSAKVECAMQAGVFASPVVI